MKLIPELLGDDFLDRTPPQYKGGVIANILGYNIFRTLYQNIGRVKPAKVRKEYQQYLDILERDGILIINDFYPKEQFEELKKEYDESFADWDPMYVNPDEFSKRQKDFPEYFQAIAEKIKTPDSPAFNKYFLNNEMISELSEAVTNRKIRTTPYHHFWYLKRRTLSKESDKGFHSAGYPHADVPYPTIKVFLYMNDVDEKNAAYIFAKGTHKLTLKRLWLEYKYSVRFAKDNNDVATSATDVGYLGSKSESICGKANTLIISNNMGYHNRGNFTSLDPRQTAQLDFRNLESWRNNMNKLDKDIFSRAKRRFMKYIDKANKEKIRASLNNNNMS